MRVGGERTVANVWSSWPIIPYDTAFPNSLPPLSPKLTLTPVILARMPYRHAVRVLAETRTP